MPRRDTKTKGMHTKEKKTTLSFIIFVSLAQLGIMKERKPVFPSFKIKDFNKQGIMALLKSFILKEGKTGIPSFAHPLSL